jgi:hypothetical protein
VLYLRIRYTIKYEVKLMMFLKSLKISLVILLGTLLIFIPKGYAAITNQKNNTINLAKTTTQSLAVTHGLADSSVASGAETSIKPKSSRVTKTS